MGLAAISLLLPLGVAQGPLQVTPFSADVQISSAGRDGGAPRDMDGKIYVAPGNMRFEMQGGPRGPMTIISDLAKKTTYTLLPAQKMYVEHQGGEMQGRMRQGPMQDMKPIDTANPCAARPGATCKKIGTESIDGRPCDHWEVTEKDGAVSTVWIDQKLRFPIKSVGRGSTAEFSNIKEGPQDPSLFQVPAGYQKMDPTMMRGGQQGGGPPQ
jgi:hypothetical protein